MRRTRVQTEPSLMILKRRTEFTVKEYAAIERVTTKTVWRWVSKGALVVRRTPGGHLRILGESQTSTK